MEQKSIKEVSILAFGDTHGKEEEVSFYNLPKADILIYTGDFMSSGYSKSQMDLFLTWLHLLPYKYKILIAGNHDRYVENNSEYFRLLVENRYTSITYLEDEGAEIEGLKIWGTPHTKIFYNWAFNKTHFEKQELFSKIPDDTDILVSHGPAYGILDIAPGNKHVGEEELTEIIEDRLPDLKLHLFGHIHCSYGMQDCGRYKAYNCSVANEQYEIVNKPHLIKLEVPIEV